MPVIPHAPADGGGGEDVGLDLGGAAVADFIGHPGFDAAMLMSATALVNLYNGNWMLNRIISDRGRFAAGLMILDLHFMESGGAGFTVGQLRREAAAHGFGSPGRMTALVATLRLFGLLRQVEAADRRRQVLVPTEAFFALHRARLRCQLEAVALIHPKMEQALPLLEDPRFLGLCAHSFMIPYRRGVRVFNQVGALRPFADRDAGLVVLFSLLLAETTGQPVSITSLARRFAVSRAHVLSILREAEAGGLARQQERRGEYRAGPLLTAAMRQLFAFLLLIHFRAAQRAMTLMATA